MKGAMENEWLCKTMPTVWWWWVILYNAYPHHHNYIIVLLQYCKYAYMYKCMEILCHLQLQSFLSPLEWMAWDGGRNGVWSGKGVVKECGPAAYVCGR